MASTVFTAASGWVFWLVGTHRWPSHDIGVATATIAALTTIALIAGQPISLTLLVFLPRTPDRRALLRAGLEATIVVACLLSFLALVILPGRLNDIRTIGIAPLFIIGSAATAVGTILDAAALALRRSSLLVARNAGFGLGKMMLLVALALPAGLVSAPFAIIVSWSVFATLSCVWSYWRWFATTKSMEGHLHPEHRHNARRGAWRTLRSGIGLQVIGALGGTLPPQILSVIVIGVLGATRSGWFSITWLVGSLCFMVSPSVCQALLAEGSHTPQDLSRRTRTAVIFSVSLLAGPILVYVFFGSFVLSFFGRDYGVHGGTLLGILALSTLPDLVTNVAVSRYRVQLRLARVAVINGVIAVVTLVIAAPFLRSFGINGAGWAWAVGQTTGCVVYAAYLLVDAKNAPRRGSMRLA